MATVAWVMVVSLVLALVIWLVIVLEGDDTGAPPAELPIESPVPDLISSNQKLQRIHFDGIAEPEPVPGLDEVNQRRRKKNLTPLTHRDARKALDERQATSTDCDDSFDFLVGYLTGSPMPSAMGVVGAMTSPVHHSSSPSADYSPPSYTPPASDYSAPSNDYSSGSSGGGSWDSGSSFDSGRSFGGGGDW